MKILNRTPLALAALLVAVAIAQDKTLMRRQLVVSEDKYSVEMSTNSSFETPVGAQEMNATGTMNYSVKIAKVDGEKADAEFLTSDLKIESDGPAAGAADSMPKQIKLTAKFDNRNRVTDVKSEGSGTGMMQMMSGMGTGSAMYFYAELPEAAVGIGDNWNVVLPANPMTPTESILTAKLTGEKDGAWVVKTTGTVPIEMDSSKMPAGADRPPMDMIMKGTMAIEADTLLDKVTHRVLSVTIKNKIKSTIEVMGTSVDSSTDVKMTYTLKK